jgi:hypothetical protein
VDIKRGCWLAKFVQRIAVGPVLEAYLVVTPDYSPTENPPLPPTSPASESGFCPITPPRPAVSPCCVLKDGDKVPESHPEVEAYFRKGPDYEDVGSPNSTCSDETIQNDKDSEKRDDEMKRETALLELQEKRDLCKLLLNGTQLREKGWCKLATKGLPSPGW